jgi:hypothetical protein
MSFGCLNVTPTSEESLKNRLDTRRQGRPPVYPLVGLAHGDALEDLLLLGSEHGKRWR